MEVSSPSTMRQEFLRRAEWRKDDERRIAERDFKARKDKEEREKKDEKTRDAEETLLVVIASEAEIGAFTVTLDTYDAATVEALQQNDEQLIKVREELTKMLDKAYVLPDGRKVFKTEDGLRVFDEHGIEVKNLDPDEIEEWRPKFEQFFGVTEEENRLIEERAGLVDYQNKLDEARERTRDSDHPLTRDELEELKARIDKDKPDAVKRVLDENVDADRAPQAGAEFDPSSLNPLRKPTAPGLDS